MLKKSTIIRNMLTTVTLIVVLLLIPATPASAKANSPYGFTYDDTAAGKTIYQYYSYSAKEDSYLASRAFYSKGNYVFTSAGVLVCNTSMASGSRYNGFDAKGNFYIVTRSGSLMQVNAVNKVSILIPNGVSKLGYNSDDLAISVTTSTGVKSLSTLQNIPEKDDDDTYNPPVATKQKNRVDIYTNSANEMVYEAYNNGKIKTKIIVKSNKNVLNSTAKVRLSDTLKGAKFMGFDPSYNVYLYESNGTLYRFKSGSWYSAEKISLSGSYKSFKKDDNGFISKIVTTKNSYTIKQLTTSSKWKANKTYAVKKSGYVTLYIKGSQKSNTLTLKSRKLSLNGKTIASGVSRYGFTASKKIIYLKKGTVYTASISSPKKAKKLCSKAKGFSTNALGLVTKVTLTKGSRKVA